MNIYEAIAAIMAEGYAIGKNQKNAQQGFKYRGIDDVMNTFQPLLAKHHVFMVPTVLEQQRVDRVTAKGTPLIYSVLKMQYTFYAEDGTHVDAVVIGEGMDSGDKASNKAMAVAMKYAMFQTFCIPTEEMRLADPDAENPPASTPAIPADVVCDCCGNKITPSKKKNGAPWNVADMVAYSAKHFNGKNLCYECMKQAKALENLVERINDAAQG